MKKPYFITSLIALIVVWQLFFIIKSLAADVINSKLDSPDISTPDRHPTIFFENPDFNFGQIYKGQKIEYIYTFENRGNDTLEIKKVKPSCGCTAVILTNKTIQPGNTGEIKATFNSSSYSGKVRKSITVSSNDPITPQIKLTVSGEVLEDITIKPKNINFGMVYIGEKVNRTFSVSSQTEPDFKIKKITSSKPFIEASIKEEKDGEYVVDVTLIHYPIIGRFSGGINLETNSKMQQKVKIPFFGEIIGDITPYPKRIYYGFVVKGKELSQKLYVKINKSDIKISNIKSFPDYISTRIIKDRKNNNTHCVIEVKLDAKAPIGKIIGKIELYSNSEIQPVTIIPIDGVIEEG